MKRKEVLLSDDELEVLKEIRDKETSVNNDSEALRFALRNYAESGTRVSENSELAKKLGFMSRDLSQTLAIIAAVADFMAVKDVSEAFKTDAFFSAENLVTGQLERRERRRKHFGRGSDLLGKSTRTSD